MARITPIEIAAGVSLFIAAGIFRGFGIDGDLMTLAGSMITFLWGFTLGMKA